MEKSVSLFYKEGSSDKEYHVKLEASNGGWVVNFSYRRRGSTLKTGTKTMLPVSLGAATQIYDKLVKEKTAKGYAEGKSTGQGFQ